MNIWFFAFVGLMIAPTSPAAEIQPAFRVDVSTLLTGHGKQFFTQSRGALIPGAPARVVVTTQETDPTGAHGYADLFTIETVDNGRTWSSPQRIDSLRRTRLSEGHDLVMGDVCPQWHAATGRVLATGKTFGFLGGTTEDRGLERVSYSVRAPQSGEWSELRVLTLPASDHEGRPFLEPNSGCHQRVDLPNGEILLPIRYRKDSKVRDYTTIVARCRFDGEKLTYVEHGSEFTIPRERGLYEPSITAFGGRYFVTMRADHSAFVARGGDGLAGKIDDGIEEQTELESPQVRRRLTRLWIAVAVAAFTTVSVIAFQTLTKASYDVPELNGLAESQARNKIAEFGWELLVQAERTNDVEFGHVIRTEPATGVSLKEGETIILVVSEGPPLGVLIDVTGQTKEAAAEKIVAQGLVVATSEDSSETTPVGSVISWSVAKQPSLVAGDEVLKGTVINLTISNGPALRVVPLIVGLTLADATSKAAELGLVLAVTPDAFNNDVAIGLIGAQSPPPDERLPRGGTLSYAISLGPDFVEMPNIVGINFNDAEKRLVAAGFVVGEVTGRKSYRMKSASVKGVAINNGDKVPRGSVIDMVFP
jgi:beta-lactam-binding protein with PASTA domain